MSRTTAKPPRVTDDDVRQIILRYLYDRNKNATSRAGKKTGAAVTISVMRADLKASYALKAQRVVSNLNYLISQRWVEELNNTKNFSTPGGTVVSRITTSYIISAAGDDKVGGPSEFMRDEFKGIKIEATGQNVITLGDGNSVNVRFREVGEALSRLRDAIKAAPAVSQEQKTSLVVDIGGIQSQLAKPDPNKGVVRSLWAVVEKAATAAGLIEAVSRAAPLISALLTQN